MKKLLCLCLIWQMIEGTNYSIQDLGTLATEESTPYSLNNQNIVTGYLRDYRRRKIDFIWDPVKGLSFLEEATVYQAPLINQENQLCGVYWHENHSWFSGKTYTKHIYLMKDSDLYQDLEYPKNWSVHSVKEDLNFTAEDKKEISIIDFTSDGRVLIANSLNPLLATQFALYENNYFKPLSPDLLRIYAINNKGMLLSRKMVQKEDKQVPFLVLYDPALDKTYEIIEDSNLLRRQLNDQNQVCLVYWLKDQSIYRAYTWNLETGLNKLKQFLPISMNNKGDMVGLHFTLDKKFIPVVWNQKHIISLNQAFESNPDWTEIKEVFKINDNGCVIATGLYKGKKHACLLMPSN